MKKRIGFVISSPLKFSQTFLLKEFRLLEELGYEILIFEGYSEEEKKYSYKRIKALPVKMNTVKSWIHTFNALMFLSFAGFVPCMRFAFVEISSGTSIVRTFKRIWFSAHILSHQVDYLHFCFADVAIQKELVAKAIKARMSVSLRGSDITLYPLKNINCYHRLWLHTEKIHAVSAWLFEQALSLGAPRDQRVHVIHDWVEPEVIPFNSLDLRNPLRIVSIGRLEPVKDHHFALDVIHQLIMDKVNLQYTIIGDGSMRKSLLSRIKELHLEQHVQLSGKEKHDDLLQHLRQFDLLLHTSISEGLGVSLLEAQASGLLLISLDSGGTEESIEDEKSGWIVRERVPEKMAGKVLAILQQQPSERLKVREYARRRIEHFFSKSKSQALWLTFFTDNGLPISK